MKKIMIDGKEHLQQEESDIPKIPMPISPDILQNPIEDFENGWHKQYTKEHICIWSDEWMKNAIKNRKSNEI